MSCSRARAGLLLIMIYLHIQLTWEQGEAQPEMRKPLFQRLRRLDEQFRRFQEVTLTHLQGIAENYNISYSIDTRFQALTQQYESISRELNTYKATTDEDLNSLKSWTKKLQKKTKKLDLRLTNMERALSENSKLSQKQVQEQRAMLSNFTQELQEHRGRVRSVEAHQEEVQGGMRGLQDSLRQQGAQINQLEMHMRSMQKSSALSSTGSSRDPLTSNRTPQDPVRGMEQSTKLQPKHSKEQRLRNRLPLPRPTQHSRPSHDGGRLRDRMHGARQTSIQAESTAQPEADPPIQNLLQLPARHKIPQHYIPKKVATICNVKSMLLFPSASTENYVTFREGFLTGIHELSICTWLRVDAEYMGTLLSYATEDNDNKLVLYGRNSSIPGSMDFVIGDPAYRELSIQNILDGRWHHLCVIWSSIEGRFWHYIDRRLISTGSKFQKGYEIPPRGLVVLGQEQDSVGGGFDEAEAFVGRMAGFAMWTRVLSPGEVSGIATGRGMPRGAVLTLDDVDQLNGSVEQVACECLEHCA